MRYFAFCRNSKKENYLAVLCRTICGIGDILHFAGEVRTGDAPQSAKVGDILHFAETARKKTILLLE